MRARIGRRTLTVREEAGAEGEVRETISWMARRSLSRWSGLLMPISRWISVSDKLAMMAPLLTLARQAATYHAGIPTHSWSRGREGQGEGTERTRQERWGRHRKKGREGDRWARQVGAKQRHGKVRRRRKRTRRRDVTWERQRETEGSARVEGEGGRDRHRDMEERSRGKGNDRCTVRDGERSRKTETENPAHVETQRDQHPGGQEQRARGGGRREQLFPSTGSLSRS